MTVKDPIRTVIWGQPGVGKTTLAATFPNPWFIDIEKSTAWMPELRPRQWGRPKSWDEIVDQIARFKRELPGDTLVIDSIDWLEAKYIEKFGSPGGKDDYGKSYNDMDKNFRKFLDELTEISEMGIHIVFTAHLDTKDVTLPDQLAAFTKYVLKMQKKTSSAILEWADEVLFLKFRDVITNTDNKGKKGKAVGGTIRDIKTIRAATYDAKNRFDLPSEFEFASDKALPEPLRTLIWDGFDAYLNLKSGNPMQPAQPVQPVMQQPTQPVQQPVQPIQQPVQPQSYPEPMQQIKPSIDPRLTSLMERDGISKEQIEQLVASKGWFNCPLEEYPADFVESMLINGWDQMKKLFEPQHDTLTITDDTLPF